MLIICRQHIRAQHTALPFPDRAEAEQPPAHRLCQKQQQTQHGTKPAAHAYKREECARLLRTHCIAPSAASSSAASSGSSASMVFFAAGPSAA